MMKAFMCAVTLVLAAVLISGCSDGKNRNALTSEHPSVAAFKPTVSTPIDPTLKSLELKSAAEELPENSETNVSVIATYVGREESDTNIVEINNGKLLAKAEGTVTIRAEAGGKLSPEKSITVYKVIHGHRLPPEPDPQLNNATLLGIDSNNNGVRDDVERWTILKYKDNHPIVTLIGLQGARAAQIIIQEPKKARETRIVFARAYNCSYYFQFLAKYNDEQLLIDKYVFGEEFKYIQFNTSQRVRAFAEYNSVLSGGVYGIPGSKDARAQCDFNVTEMLKNGQ